MAASALRSCLNRDSDRGPDIAHTTALQPVILAGGAGTRLWPLSRADHPKPFLRLDGAQSPFQATVRRLEGLDAAPPIVVCNAAHRFLVAEQLEAIGVTAAAILLEPEGRNTAPAVALAALHARADGVDPVLLALPADHRMDHPAGFRAAVPAAGRAAAEGGLVTFGVPPTRPEPGFGYIRPGPDEDEGGAARPVAEFREKPDPATATALVKAGGWYWNSGIFAFRASAYLAELDRHAPAVARACRAAMAGARADFGFLRPEEAAFRDCPSGSVDYALMERTDRARMIPLEGPWSAGWGDIGSWEALTGLNEPEGSDEAGNVATGDTRLRDCRDSRIHAENRLVAAIGLEGLVVAETADAVLVAPRARAEEAAAIVAGLRAEGRPEADHHPRVRRPWGRAETLAAGERFRVKRLEVRPGAALSLQRHHHRAEHWTVVHGTARVHLDGTTFDLGEDQSTYIPVGATHRLENPGPDPLEVVETQTGHYLEEDDIIRLEAGRPG